MAETAANKKKTEVAELMTGCSLHVHARVHLLCLQAALRTAINLAACLKCLKL
jgi:hypothetical protein